MLHTPPFANAYAYPHVPLKAELTAEAEFQTTPVHFDGADSLLTPATNHDVVDSKTGTFFAWINSGMTSGEGRIFHPNNSKFMIRLGNDGTGRLEVMCKNAAGTEACVMFTKTDFWSPGWHSVLASWDVANGLQHLFVDDLDDQDTDSVIADLEIDYTPGQTSIGRRFGLSNWFTGDLSQMWIWPGKYVDITTSRNRRKFTLPNGKPKNLGTDGSAGGVGQPAFYFENTVPGSWGLHNGFETEQFTIKSGTLTASAATPND